MFYSFITIVILLIFLIEIQIHSLNSFSKGTLRKEKKKKKSSYKSSLLKDLEKKDLLLFSLKTLNYNLVFLLAISTFYLAQDTQFYFAYIFTIFLLFVLSYILPLLVPNLIEKFALHLLFISKNLCKILVPYSQLLIQKKLKKIQQKKVDMEDEILALIETKTGQHFSNPQEKSMIEKIFYLNDIKVKTIMVPRVKLIAASSTASLKELKDIIKKNNVNRIPIFKKNIDSIIGILKAKDLLDKKEKDFSLNDILLDPLFVKSDDTIHICLQKLKQKKRSDAIVVDEYGGNAGLVTISHILTQIVGEIPHI